MATYQGTSIVDYLKSVGQPSDFTSRSQLATQKGIQNYTGTAEQNVQLLNLLRTPQVPAGTTTSATTAPTAPLSMSPTPITTPTPTQQNPQQQAFTSFLTNAANQTIQRAQQTGQPQSVSVDANSRAVYEGLGFTVQRQGNQLMATYNPPSAQTAQPVGQTSSQKSYVNIQGAFFEQTPQGLAAVADPTVLRQLQSGQIQAQGTQTEGQTFAQAISTPQGIQQTQPVQQLPTPQQPEQPKEQTLGESFSDLLKRTYGIDISADLFKISPAASIGDIQTKLFEQAGLGTVKKNIDDINARIKAIDVELGDKVSEVNANPWISESQRQRKINQLNEKYDARRNAEVNQLRLQESVYNQAREDVRFVAQQVIAENARVQGLEQKQVQLFLDLAEQAFEEQRKLKEFDSSRYKEVQGGLYDLKEGRFIVQPKPTSAAGSDLLSPTEAAALGVPFGTTEAEAFGKIPQKPATAAQETVAGYAARIEQANPILDSVTSPIVGMNVVNFESQIKLPAQFQNNTVQRYMQAARNFINAVLRRESGAVISDEEFREARQQYLPQPGDSDEVLKQKKANRALVFESFKRSAGSAYQSVEDLLGETNTVVKIQGRDVPVGSIITNKEGKRGRVNSDGTITPL